MRARPEQLQRCFDCGVASTDHYDVESEAAMRLVKVVCDERKRFARHIHQVRLAKVSCRKYQSLAVDGNVATCCSQRAVDYVTVTACVHQFRVRTHTKPIGTHHAAIVLECFFTRRFLPSCNERMAADLEQFGSGEKTHPDGIANNGVGDGAGLDDQRIDSALSGRNRTRQPDGAAAGNHRIFKMILLHGESSKLQPHVHHRYHQPCSLTIDTPRWVMNVSKARVLVTGGSSGIGKATALALAEMGAKVAICGRNRAAVEQAAGETGATPFVADVSSETDVVALIPKVIKALGGYDVLINNAGFGRFAPLVETKIGRASCWESV